MTVVDDYQAQTEALAASTAAGVLALYAALQTGGLAPATVIPAMAAVIATANAAATTLADVGVSAQIEAATAHPQPATGIAPRDDTERLAKAVETILDDPGDEPKVEPVSSVDTDSEPVSDPGVEPEPDPAAKRLERLARAEPLETGQAVTVEIINRIPRVAGWTRVLDADPCERCQRWAEDGRVFPKDAHFKRHLNCNCQQQVVVTGGETSSDTTREAESA